MRNLIFGISVLFIAFNGLAANKSMVRTLDMISDVYEVGYAPKAWKKKFANWDLSVSINQAKQKVETTQNMSVKDFQLVLRDFFLSTKDYHVGFRFDRTEQATAPFTVKSAAGKYFFTFIDRDKLPRETFPFVPGDEIVEFDGKPIADVLKKLRQEAGQNVLVTDQAVSELRLTARSASRGLSVPKGTFQIGVKTMKAKQLAKQAKKPVKVTRHQLIWEYKAEKIREPQLAPVPSIFGLENESILMSNFKPQKSLAEIILAHRSMLAPIAESLIGTHDDLDVQGSGSKDNKKKPKENPFSVGAKTSMLPDLGKVVWRNSDDKLFTAYIYQNDKKDLIGFLRINRYSLAKEEDYVRHVSELVKIIKKFESTTDGLVIDQQNNPGGSVFYLYTIASLLTDQPLRSPRHRMTITQKDVLEAINGLEKLKNVKTSEDAKKAIGKNSANGLPIDYQFVVYVRNYFQFIIDQWNSGNTLTEPYFIWGADTLNPHPKARYSKPILILVNELCFSGGDFFPAIMQDNGRAKIMGARTAGAGGYVLRVQYPNRFGLNTFSYTGSLAERVGGNPIENLGVKPDVEYKITEADLTRKFQDYKKVINDQIQKML